MEPLESKGEHPLWESHDSPVSLVQDREKRRGSTCQHHRRKFSSMLSFRYSPVRGCCIQSSSNEETVRKYACRTANVLSLRSPLFCLFFYVELIRGTHCCICIWTRLSCLTEDPSNGNVEYSRHCIRRSSST